MNSPRFAVIHFAKSLEKTTARPNFYDKREQKRIYSFLPNGAKISTAKLVKEYACPNPLTDRMEEGSTGYKKRKQD